LDGEGHAYQEDRKRKLKQQDGCKRHPLEQQQVEQRIDPQLLKSEQRQPQQSSLRDYTIPNQAPGQPRVLFHFQQVRLFLLSASH